MVSGAPEALPPLREVIAREGLRARKGLGQHFILDLNLTRRIARQGGVTPGTPVLEVGPGPGGLTRALLMEGAAPLLVVERDERVAGALAEIAAAYPGRLHIHMADALEVDERALMENAGLAGGTVRVVANLPYNVATPLLIKWLKADPWPPWWHSLTVMVQKEVADRLCAAPRTGAYGRLSVIAQIRAQASRLFDVPPSAFVPPPKVMSSVLTLTPVKTTLSAETLAALESVTAAAFGQRRKMLRSSLKDVFTDVPARLAALGLPATARAEELDLSAFADLARALAAERRTRS